MVPDKTRKNREIGVDGVHTENLTGLRAKDANDEEDKEDEEAGGGRHNQRTRTRRTTRTRRPNQKTKTRTTRRTRRPTSRRTKKTNKLKEDKRHVVFIGQKANNVHGCFVICCLQRKLILKKRRNQIRNLPDKNVNAPLVANQGRTVIQSVNYFSDVLTYLKIVKFNSTALVLKGDTCFNFSCMICSFIFLQYNYS